MASDIYILIWLLTYFTYVYATLLLGGGGLSIKITLLSKSFKSLLVHDQIFAYFYLNRWWGEEEEDDDHDDHDYQYYYNNITTFNLIWTIQHFML